MMETIEEEIVDSMVTDTDLSAPVNGGYMFSLDTTNGLTTTVDGNATYVTLPLHLLQDQTSLDGGHISVYLNSNQLTLLTGGTQTDLSTEQASEGDGQLILDTGEGTNTDELNAGVEVDVQGIDLSALEFTNLADGENILCIEDADGNLVQDRSGDGSYHFVGLDDSDAKYQTSLNILKSIKENQANVAKRGPGRPKKENADVVDPPIGKGPYKCEICNKDFPLWTQLKRHNKVHSNDKPHRCNQCSSSFNVESNLTLHMATHNTGDPRCPECHKSFARVASLKAHVMLHEKEESVFCSECGDEFTTMQQLEHHKKEHLDEWVQSTRVHQCRQCQRQYTRASAYREHMKEHHRVKASLVHKYHKRNIDRSAFSHKCDACDKFFQKPSQLIRHKRIHTGERPYACTICSKTFNQKGSLLIHMCKHNGYKPFPCEFCPAAFSQKGNLRAHIARVHAIPNSGEEVYSCAECTCVFKKLGSLNSHMSRSHGTEEQLKNRNTNDDMGMAANVNATLAELVALDGEKSQQEAEDILQQALVNSGLGSNRKLTPTTVGGQQVRKDSELNEEKNGLSTILLLSDIGLDGVMRRYNIGTRTVGKVRWLECSYCSKEFKKPSDIVRHIRVHTHERPYKCDRCSRSFAVKSTLTAHQRTHTGQKDHVCTICTKTFTSASSLKVHQRIHSDTKPFACNICERKFRTSGHRRAHLIIAHKNRKQSRSVLKPVSQRTEVNDFVDVPLQEPIVITDNGTLVQFMKKEKNFLPGDAISLERPYKCLICSLAFRKSSHLIQHTRMHTGERPYQCMQCSKRFLTNGILKIHMRSHAGLRPYKCDECQRLFSTNGSLKRHMATHSTVRPFMCPYCHKTFKSSICTRKHMKTHVSELAQQKASSGIEIADDSLLEKSDGGIEKHFTAPDFTQAFSDQPFTVETTEEVGSDDTFSHHLPQDGQDVVTDCDGQINQTVITHTLHADASGMITLPQQEHSTLTQENIREIERTLNEQIFGNNGAMDEAAEGPDHDSDLESTTTEDLARTLASEPNEIGAPITAQILSNKVDPSGNIYESYGFDFSTITMQVGEGDDVDVMTMDENTLSANMAILLSGQAQEGNDISGLKRKDPKEDDAVEEKGNEVDSSVADSDRPHVCVICQRGFKKSSHLKAHLMTHNKQVAFPCETCSKKFYSMKTLKSHQRTHCEKEFACHLCTARLTTNGSLIRHMTVHSSAKPFKCSICTDWFRTPVELRKHIGLHEPRETQGRVIAKEAAAEASTATYPRFRKRSSIIRLTAEQTETLARQSAQEAVSVSEQVLIASAAEANRISELKDPDQQYSLEPLHPNQCKYCPKSFRKPSDLVRHVRIHTGERPYKCTCCNKCFTVKSTLDSHLKTHTGSKSFTCHVCGCVFSTKGSLKVHMRLHTGAKPFKCPLCEQKFRTSGHRKAHLMVHVKDASKKEVSSVLTQRMAARHPKRIKPPPPPPPPPAEIQPAAAAQNGGLDELATYFSPVEAFFGPADVTGFQLQLADNSNVHISTGVEAQGNLMPNTRSVQIDEVLLQQLQSSNVIFQTTGPDVGSGNVINMGEMNGNLRYEIHTDEHGQIINIQPMQDDGLVSNIAFNFGEELNIAVNEEQQEAKPMKFRVVEGNDTGKSYVAVPPKKKKANEGDEDFSLHHECEVCGKQFVKPSQLERHKRIHTGERPFQCNLCEKAFTQKNSLMAHVKSHTGDKPHKCTLCSYSSTQRGNLKTHMRRAHQFSASILLKNQKVGRSLPSMKDVSSELNIDSEVKSLDLDFVAELFPQIRHPNSFK